MILLSDEKKKIKKDTLIKPEKKDLRQSVMHAIPTTKTFNKNKTKYPSRKYSQKKEAQQEHA